MATAHGSSSEPDEQILAWLSQAEGWILLCLAVIAGTIFLLWFIPPLAALAPSGWSKMTANTATGLLLCGLSLHLSAPRKSLAMRNVSQLAAIVVLMLGLLSLVEYAEHISFGIEHWLPEDSKALYPGRISPQTALTFCVTAVCLLLIRQHKNRLSAFADLATLILIGLLLVLIGGHIFKAPALVGVSPTVVTSQQTLLSFMLIALVILSRRATHGRRFSVLVGIGIGSQIVRKVMPLIAVVPFAVFSALAYSINYGWIDIAYGRAIGGALGVFLGMYLIVWMARRINMLERQLRDLSLRDELTGAHNRRGFYLLAEQAKREAERHGHFMTVLFFDLDGLKRANDTLGHAAGSKLIHDFARVLLQSFKRETDIVGRIGGDEFATITHGPGSQRDIMLERVEEGVAALNRKALYIEWPISYSVGYSELSPDADSSLDQLMSKADAMMYENKVQKKGSR